jgi:hypothetical protein
MPKIAEVKSSSRVGKKARNLYKTFKPKPLDVAFVEPVGGVEAPNQGLELEPSEEELAKEPVPNLSYDYSSEEDEPPSKPAQYCDSSSDEDEAPPVKFCSKVFAVGKFCKPYVDDDEADLSIKEPLEESDDDDEEPKRQQILTSVKKFREDLSKDIQRLKSPHKLPSYIFDLY